MNIGQFMFNIANSLMQLGKKLYDVFTADISIKWVQTILNFFGAEFELPESISLYWILTSAGAGIIIALIVYRVFK